MRVTIEPKDGQSNTEREAAWLRTESARPFAIKVYIEDVNACLGEPRVETVETWKHRALYLEKGMSLQDYWVPHRQRWLDIFKSDDGNFYQFCAQPLGSQYAGDASIQESKNSGLIRIEIMPAFPDAIPSSEDPTKFTIIVEWRWANGLKFRFGLLSKNDTIRNYIHPKTVKTQIKSPTSTSYPFSLRRAFRR